MNLFNSIIITCVIIASIWFIASIQTNIAYAIENKNMQMISSTASKETLISTQSATRSAVERNSLRIAGITQKIQLANIQLFWKKFTDRNTLHKQLKQKPKHVYVLYQDISDDYKSASVTIGYNINVLKNSKDHISIKTAKQTSLLAPESYSDKEISQAWKRIDYRQPLNYVLEVHLLNNSGDVLTTEVFASYKVKG